MLFWVMFTFLKSKKIESKEKTKKSFEKFPKKIQYKLNQEGFDDDSDFSEIYFEKLLFFRFSLEEARLILKIIQQ